MSAQEFGEWKVMFSVEGLHPADVRERHGQSLEAILLGPSRRKNGGAWSASDFITADPWKALEQKLRPVAVPTRAQRRAQLDALNRMIAGR